MFTEKSVPSTTTAIKLDLIIKTIIVKAEINGWLLFLPLSSLNFFLKKFFSFESQRERKKSVLLLKCIQQPELGQGKANNSVLFSWVHGGGSTTWVITFSFPRGTAAGSQKQKQSLDSSTGTQIKNAPVSNSLLTTASNGHSSSYSFEFKYVL